MRMWRRGNNSTAFLSCTFFQILAHCELVCVFSKNLSLKRFRFKSHFAEKKSVKKDVLHQHFTSVAVIFQKKIPPQNWQSDFEMLLRRIMCGPTLHHYTVKKNFFAIIFYWDYFELRNYWWGLELDYYSDEICCKDSQFCYSLWQYPIREPSIVRPLVDLLVSFLNIVAPCTNS